MKIVFKSEFGKTGESDDRRTYRSVVLETFSGFQNPLLVAIMLSAFFVKHAHPQTVDEIFHNFKTAYEKSENFSANFEETTLFADKKSVARGQFIFGKPNLLRKEYVDRERCLKSRSTYRLRR